MAEAIEGKTKTLYDRFCVIVQEIFGDATPPVVNPVEQAIKKFAEVKAKDGSVITYEGETPMEGMPVFVILPDGGQAPVPDGVIQMEDGAQMEVLAGKVVAFKPGAAPEPPATTPEQMGGTETLSEQAAKRVIESVTKETHYSKAEVDAMVAGLKAEFAAVTKVADEAKAEAANLKAQNDTITTEFSAFKAQVATITDRFAKHETFAIKIQELLKEPQEPQVPKPVIPDPKNNPAKLSPEEWRKKYIDK